MNEFAVRRLSFLFVCLVAWGGSAAPLRAETLAIVGATVVDTADFGRRGADLEDATVLVEGDRIAAVGPRSEVAVPEGARLLDGAGAFVVPGLTDGFAAINNQAYADAYLAAGVTSIIAVGGGRRGELFLAGEPSPETHRLCSAGRRVTDLAAQLAEVEAGASAGCRVMLLMYGLTDEQLPAVTARAEELGMATLGELGHARYASGVAAGIDSFVHTTRYSLDLAPREMAAAVARQPFSDDLESPKWQYYLWLARVSPHYPRLAEHAATLASGQAALMPTLSLIYLDLPWARNPWDDPIAALVDRADVNRPADPATGRHDDLEPVRQIAYTSVARGVYLVEEAYRRAGARYLAGSGTDVWGTMPGISLHTELEGLVEVGLSPREALAAATSNFAATLNDWPEVGEVRAGQRADLLILERDPTGGRGQLALDPHRDSGGQAARHATAVGTDSEPDSALSGGRARALPRAGRRCARAGALRGSRIGSSPRG